MSKNRFSIAASAMVMAAVLLLGACHHEDPDVYTPQSYTYETTVFGTSDVVQVTLDKITSKIIKAESSDSWVKVTVLDETDSGNHPIISIQTGKPGTDGAKASVEAVAENGDRATVTVRHSSLSVNDEQLGANSGWNDSWWLYEKVALEGIAKAQQTPWNPSSSSNIPEEIRKQINPDDGWEMAFSYLNDSSLMGVRYFALYNKWTGQVRLYTYIVDPTGWGSDLVLNLYCGHAMSRDMYPLYNLFEYGIPTNHTYGTTLSRTGKIVSRQSQSFQTWLSPYMYSSSIIPGWYCFEFDMSGYVPAGKNWLNLDDDSPRFKVFAETFNNQSINLKGALKGDIGGTFEDPEIIEHGGASAVSGVLGMLGSGLSAVSGMATSSIAGGANYAYLMAHGGDEGLSGLLNLNPIKYWGGFACSVAGGLFSVLSSLDQEPVTYEKIPGKIDLTMDATMELDGYIKSATSNSLAPLSVSAKGIRDANGENGHMGKGVWSLAEDPVVYIDKEDFLSVQQNFNVLCKKDGYSNPDFGGYDVRIVYAFDPTSVKLNLNGDLFKDIQDVTVTANLGVLPGNAYGHTDPYRQMLTMGARPSFSFAEGKTSGSVSLSGRTTPCIWKIGLDEFADGAYETSQNCTVYAQKTADGTEWQRYYGRVIDLPEMGKKIIVDPQVFIPYSVNEEGKCTAIGFPTSPDFVVRIDVEFTALDDNGERKTFQFGKLYVPKVEMVDYDGMCEVADRLRAYSAKCENKQPINNLSSDASVPVRFPGGHMLVSKTIRLLEKLDM